MRVFSSAVVLYSQFIEYSLLFWKQPGTWGISMDSIVYISIGVQELTLVKRNGQLRILYLETSFRSPSCISEFPLYCIFILPLKYPSVLILFPWITSPTQPPFTIWHYCFRLSHPQSTPKILSIFPSQGNNLGIRKVTFWSLSLYLISLGLWIIGCLLFTWRHI